VNPIEKRWTQITTTAAATATATATATEVEESAEEQLSQTFICEGARFEGTLRLGRQSLRIDCEFKGEIVTDGKVVIGQGGAIESDIRAREVVIYGAVVGNVSATRLLELRAGCRLHGDIETPCLQIDRQGFFVGNTKMARPAPTLETQEAALPSSKTESKSETKTRAKTKPKASPAPTA
jgi:cytoskeletal protein CcmA (bactofilin family)